MSSAVLLIVSCRKCRREMGQVSEDELKHLVSEDERGPLCFDCEDEGADAEPEIFWDWQKGESFRVGGMWFCAIVDGQGYETFVQSHARVSAGTRGLSSYTNLNRNNAKTGNLQDLAEFESCPLCEGARFLNGTVEVDACPVCGGVGLICSAIYLPRWIFGAGVDNA